MGDLLNGWDELRKVKIWVPTQFLEGITVIDGPGSAQIVMPMRLSANQDKEPCNNDEHRSFTTLTTYAITEDRLPEEIKYEAILFLEGRVPSSGAGIEEIGVSGIHFIDQFNDFYRPAVHVNLPMAGEIIELDLQELVLERNNKLGPEGFTLGRSIESFKNLTKLIENDSFLDWDSTTEEVEKRVSETVALINAETKTKIYGVDLTLDRLGIVGLICLVSLQLYFLLHVWNTLGKVSKDSFDESWIGTQGNVYALVGVTVSSCVLPIAAGTSTAYSMFETVDEAADWIYVTLMITAFAVVCLALGTGVLLKRIHEEVVPETVKGGEEAIHDGISNE